MGSSVSAVEANRQFSRVLRTVRDGESVVITAHGRPVARIVPIRPGDEAEPDRRDILFDRLRDEPVVDAGRWSRDELYER